MKLAVDIRKSSKRTSVLLGFLLVFTFGCGRQSPGQAPKSPTNFTSGVDRIATDREESDLAQTDALAKEKAAADAKAEEERKLAELAKDTALFDLDRVKEKMAALQNKLTIVEAKKNSLSDRINAIDVELASIVVPSGQSLQAFAAFVSGNYLAGIGAKNQAEAARNAALKKKTNLTNLRVSVSSDLEAASLSSTDLEAQIEALDKEIFEATGKAYGQF